MLLLEAQKYLEIVRNRGEAGTELNRVYRILRCKELYLMAYAKLYANKGAMTPGRDPNDIVDGMSIRRIDSIIQRLEEGTYIWKPVRRAYRQKANSKKLRPLGLPGWEDKMLQEVMRLVLEAYYEPQFRESSHGFRPNRGCHTALDAISKWQGVRWFIEGDIKGCFDNIAHEIVIRILKRKIQDRAFMQLLKEMLEAGYMEDWKYYRTYSGTPQGGIISPLLMNVVLNELDTFVEDTLIPKYTTGKRRKANPEYANLQSAARRARKRGEWEDAKKLRKAYTQLPSKMSNDPEFRRLWYARYADDTLLGFIGPKAEAEAIKREFGNFLCTIRLEMSEEKTMITHASTEKARFLNYGINLMHDDSRKKAQWNGRTVTKQRTLSSQLYFSIPKDVTQQWVNRVQKDNTSIHRPELLHLSDYDIVSTYEIQLQGLINYYQKAHNVKRAMGYVRYKWEVSLAKTLACKHKTNVKKIYRRYGKFRNIQGRKLIGVEIQREGREPLRAVFGKKLIRRQRGATIKDDVQTVYITRNQLITRLLARVCELCGQEDISLIGHHVRKLKDLRKRWQGRQEKPDWVKRMIAIRRKVLFVCPTCHKDIHNGTYDRAKLT